MISFSGLRDNSQRAHLTITLFWAIILTSIATMLLNMLTIAFPVPSESEEFGAANLVYIAVALVFLCRLAAIILGTIFFLQWFRRAYFNLREAGVYRDYSDGWAVGAWFVPFMNLVRPYSIMKEVWYGTLNLAGRSPNHVLIRWWWAAYLAHSIIDNLTRQAAKHTDDTLALELFALFFDIASAVLTLTVVRHIHEAEREVQLRHQVQQLGGAAPELDNLHPTEEEQYA